jgi:protein TonB
MLEDSLFESECRGKTRKPFTVAIAVIAHAVTIGALVLIPLLQTQALTLPPVNLSLLAPRLKTSSDVGVFSAHPQARNRVMPKSDALTAPQSIPQHLVIAEDSGSPVIGLPSGGDGTGRIPPDLLIPSIGDVTTAPEVAPAPPPPAPVIKSSGPVRIGGGVQAGNLIHEVRPVYPRLAQQTRVQGVVVLEAVIARDGSVKGLRLISGHPLLNQAAVDAVQQWLYRPTLLNGDPVEVATTITVTFTLR